MKKIFILVLSVTITLVGYGQSTQTEIDKHISDPQRNEKSGKADAIISKQKNIYDSSTVNGHKAESANIKKRCGKVKQRNKIKSAK